MAEAHERKTHEHRFRVMGTDAHVIVVGGAPALLARATARLEALEARWSRFCPDSELSRLNAAAGRPVVVSALTFSLLERALEARERTDGAFDPTVLPALLASGYDRDFAEVSASGPHLDASTPRAAPAPGAGTVELDRVVGSVHLAPGTALDLGGIAKGFAADLVVDELLGAGAHGACVNVGGDLRVSGAPPGAPAWAVAIEAEPGIDATTTGAHTLVLAEGAVATSSCRRRVWRRHGEVQHHLIDPRTGRPARSPWSSVTVVAGRAADAEPAATAALLADDAAAAEAVLGRFGAVGIAFDHDGRATPLGGIDSFLPDAA